MLYEEIKELLAQRGFFNFTAKRDKNNRHVTYTYHSIVYYAVNIVVDTIKLDKERIVTRVKIANINIDDEKELIPTLNGLYKIHNAIVYGNRKSNKNYGKVKTN